MSWDPKVFLRCNHSATKAATLQLLRVSSRLLPVDAIGEIVSRVMNVVSDEDETPAIRCLGFSSLAALLRRQVAVIEDLDGVATLCVSVLLCETNWQHRYKLVKVRLSTLLHPHLTDL